MAHKKGGGSSRNGRGSNAQFRGVKVYGGEQINAGGIIVRHLDVRAALAVALVLLVSACTIIGLRARQTPAPEWTPPAG